MDLYEGDQLIARDVEVTELPMEEASEPPILRIAVPIRLNFNLPDSSKPFHLVNAAAGKTPITVIYCAPDGQGSILLAERP